MDEIKNFIVLNENKKTRPGMHLLSRLKCQELVELIKKYSNVKICGFEGYHVYPDGSLQSDQTYWRDYNRFNSQQAWELCYEYFNKDTSTDVEYEIYLQPSSN